MNHFEKTKCEVIDELNANEILSILEHKIKQETLMTFYEDERKDIIDFDKSCKINVNEKY